MKSSNETRQKLIDITYDEIYEKVNQKGPHFQKFYQKHKFIKVYVLLFLK